MAYDNLSPVAPARLKCLLLPCGRIKKSDFVAHVQRLRQVDTLRLGDISPNGRPDRTMFSPVAFPTGVILYDLLVADTTSSHASLVPFEIYRDTLGVIGIANGSTRLGGKSLQNGGSRPSGTLASAISESSSETDSFTDLLGEVVGLKERYPSALLHQVFVFNYDNAELELPMSIVPVPSLSESKTTTMKTLMCDFTSLLLAEMTSYARSLQALPNVETPKPIKVDRPGSDYYDNESSKKIPPSGAATPRLDRDLSRSSSPALANIKSQHRASMPVNGYSGADMASMNERSQHMSLRDGAGPPRAFDDTGESTLQSRPLSRDAISTTGFGSGTVGERARARVKGRISVLIGSLYLLAGRWPDAIKELSEGASTARANSDHVWQAKALDYILVCVLMTAWAGMDFEIPQICYPIADKSTSKDAKSSKHTPSSSMPDLSASSFGRVTSRLVALQNLCQLLPDLTNNILNLYVRGATFTSDQVPQLVFSETAIRLARLLGIVEAAKGRLDDGGLEEAVRGKKNTASYEPLPSTSPSFLSRSDIAEFTLRAFPILGSDRSLFTTDQVSVLVGIAAILSDLGYHRKKAFVLKEAMSVLLSALVQSRKDSAAELGMHPAASLASFDFCGDLRVSSDTSSNERIDRGVQGFLNLVCQVYGVVSAKSLAETQTRSLPQTSDGDSHSQASLDQSHLDATAIRALDNFTLRSFGDRNIKAEVLRSCINICEALPDFDGVLRFSADLLRTAGSGIIPASNSHDGATNLSIDDQARLYQNVIRTISAAKQLGLEHVETEYWDEFLIRNIEVTKGTLARTPSPQVRARVAPVSAMGQKGPFLHNAWLNKSKAAASKDAVLVAGEEAAFSVIIENLYDFEIEIERISLDAYDVSLETMASGIFIGPYRTQTVIMSGVPQSTGLLKINGCVAKIKGCRERRFSLFPDPWSGFRDPKMKKLGLDFVPNDQSAPTSSAPEQGKATQQLLKEGPKTSQLTVNVVESQPHVIVPNVSLPQSAITLFQGEMRTFTFTLQNVSASVVADFILLAFTDDSSSSRSSQLQNLSPAERYEAELDASKHQALQWRRESETSDIAIPPQGTRTFEIAVLGKPHLTSGTITVDYGFMGDASSPASDTFYARQLSIPIRITVSPSPVLLHNDFLPFSSDFAWQNRRDAAPNPKTPQSTTPPPMSATPSSSSTRPRTASRGTFDHPSPPENRFRSLLSRLGLGGDASAAHCLLLLDLHNPSPSTLAISVQIRQTAHRKDSSSAPSPTSSLPDPWQRAYTAHETLAPHQTSRLVLLLPRLHVAHPYAPIPSLDPRATRQFVVGASTTDPDDERRRHETFWYREEVLHLVRAEWRDERSSRRGVVSLRGLQLEGRMLRALREEDVAVAMCLVLPSSELEAGDASSGGGGGPVAPSASPRLRQTGAAAFVAPASTFLVLRTTIANRLPHAISPLLRLQPSLLDQPSLAQALDLSKHFAFNGLLQQALPELGAGETRVVELGVVFLSRGRFEVRAVVEEGRGWRDGGGGGGGDGKGGTEGGGEGKIRGAGEEVVGGLGFGRERRVWGAGQGLVVTVRDE